MSDVSLSTPDADFDPKKTLAYRGLKVAIIVLSSLIVLALVMIVVGLATRMSGKASDQVSHSSNYTLPENSRILSAQVAQNRLILQVAGQRGESVLIFNTDNAQLVGQIAAPKR